MRRKELFASFMLMIATMMWGLGYSIQSISAADLGTYTIVFFKGIGGIFLLPLIMIMKRRFTGKAILEGLLIGCFCFAGCALQQKGIELSGTAKAGFLTVLYIVFVPVIQLLRGKKISRKMILAILIALTGLYFLCITEDFRFSIGDIYLLLCAVCFAVQIIMIDEFVEHSDGLVLSLVSQTTVAIMAAVVALCRERPFPALSPVSWLSILYIVFVAGAFAMTVQTVYQKDLDPGVASLLMSFESVFAALFGWLLLHQAMTVREIFGCVLVMIAIIIAD
ncbi:MAG: DMT family transporter [Erysipelotrichaceae bacterium]|nr:DMT family transporter [Erysipelotrichaceae bacterium]